MQVGSPPASLPGRGKREVRTYVLGLENSTRVLIRQDFVRGNLGNENGCTRLTRDEIPLCLCPLQPLALCANRREREYAPKDTCPVWFLEVADYL